MKGYTFSEARQRFAAILEQASAVRIKRHDGQSFVLMPEPPQGSPPDVEGVTPSQPVTRQAILQAVREGRRGHD